MSSSGYSKLFTKSSHAAVYATFRPTYPASLFEQLLKFHSGPQALAIDVATGSGQAAAVLADSFTRVIGFDVSEEQVARAPKLDNVEFQVGSAESIPIEDGEADLITVAQALHWFDLPTFYAEAHRSLRAGGTLASWGYATCTLGSEELDEALDGFYNGTLGDKYWSDRRKLVDAEYVGMEPDESMFETTRIRLDMIKPMPLSAFMGYLSTWSAYQTYCERNGEAEGDTVLAELQERFRVAIGPDASPESELSVNFPVFVLMSKKV